MYLEPSKLKYSLFWKFLPDWRTNDEKPAIIKTTAFYRLVANETGQYKIIRFS
jgi:hypothetical protein